MHRWLFLSIIETRKAGSVVLSLKMFHPEDKQVEI